MSMPSMLTSAKPWSIQFSKNGYIRLVEKRDSPFKSLTHRVQAPSLSPDEKLVSVIVSSST